MKDINIYIISPFNDRVTMRFMLKKGPGGYEVHLNYNFVGKKENITRKQSYYNTVLRNKNFKTFN